MTPVTLIIRPFIGVITPFITGRGPSCGDKRTFPSTGELIPDFWTINGIRRLLRWPWWWLARGIPGSLSFSLAHNEKMRLEPIVPWAHIFPRWSLWSAGPGGFVGKKWRKHLVTHYHFKPPVNHHLGKYFSIFVQPPEANQRIYPPNQDARSSAPGWHYIFLGSGNPDLNPTLR